MRSLFLSCASPRKMWRTHQAEHTYFYYIGAPNLLTEANILSYIYVRQYISSGGMCEQTSQVRVYHHMQFLYLESERG